MIETTEKHSTGISAAGVPVTFRTSTAELALFRKLADHRFTSMIAIIAAKAREAAGWQGKEPEKIDGSQLIVDTNFSVRISPEIKALITSEAESAGISGSELIHQWLWEELGKDGIAVLTKPTPRAFATCSSTCPATTSTHAA